MILLCFVVAILICSLLIAMLKENVLATAIIALWLGNIRKFIILIYNKHFNHN